MTGRLNWVTMVTLVGLASVVLFVIMNPPLIFTDNTPAGGDMGAHVYAPAYLRDVLIPQGRVLGWSNDWYAGFPVFYFYFPLPSLTIVLLDLLLPYGVAFKMVAVAGLVALPPSAYYFCRCLQLGRGMSVVGAAATLPFTIMESYSIYGGNIASTLAGEFAYTWSFSLGLVYLGLFTKALWDDRKYLPWAAVVLGATALSHILTTIVLVIASLFALLWRKNVFRAIGIWFWGFLIAGFWAVPLLFRIGFSSDMAWSPLNTWEELLPIELWIPLLVAVPGAVWALRRSMRFLPVLVATLVAPIYYPLPHLLPEWFPNLFIDGRWKLWNGRLLPYWYFGVTFFAAIGVGALAVALVRRLPARISGMWPRILGFIALIATTLVLRSINTVPDWIYITVLFLGLAAIGTSMIIWSGPPSSYAVVFTIASIIVGVGGVAGLSFVNGWAVWNFEGYEQKDPWPEYRGLMDQVDQLPDGRIQWEVDSAQLDSYGTPMALMLFPYWTGGGHPSMEGLFFESSLTTPFHFLNAAEVSQMPSNPIPGLNYHSFDLTRAAHHLNTYGVRYYVAFSDLSKTAAEVHPDYTAVATSEPFTIFELPSYDLIEVAQFQPAVYSQPEDSDELVSDVTDATGESVSPGFFDFALSWYDNIDNLDHWVTEDGPEDWPRISSVEELPRIPLPTSFAEVTQVEVEQHRISFRTDAVGVPHLIKVSYFPNWNAQGADGPYYATPSLMVVVPTENEVVLEFQSELPENVGVAMTIVGLLSLGGWHWRHRLFSWGQGTVSLIRRREQDRTDDKVSPDLARSDSPSKREKRAVTDPDPPPPSDPSDSSEPASSVDSAGPDPETHQAET